MKLNKSIKRLTFSFVSLLILASSMVSCVDTVIIPDKLTVDEDMWKTKSDIQGIVAAAYSNMKNQDLMRDFIVWGDFRSDEMVVNNSTSITNSSAYKVPLTEIYSMNILPSNPFCSYLPLYTTINYCNMVLEKAEEVLKLDPDYTQGDLDADCSKALALRSLCYFYLVRVFHDVPLELNAYWSSEQTKENITQVAPSVVLEQCINDLKKAEVGAIGSNVYEDWRDKGYITRDGVCALLADIYLWRASITGDANDYNNAIAYCDKIIAAKKEAHTMKRGESVADYYLSDYRDYYDDLFSYNYMLNSEESIFEIQFVSQQESNARLENNVGMFQMLCRYNASGASNPPYLCTTPVFGKSSASAATPNIFKNTEDVRLKEFVYAADAQQDQYLIRKYVAEGGYNSVYNKDVATSSSRNTFTQNWIVYRLTDIMLMKAEALVQLAEMASSDEEKESLNKEAFELVKFVNDRALPEGSASGLNYNTYSTQMEKLVLQERARELCFEGKRWFDLMRYNYRHLPGGVKADITKTFAEMDSYISNSDEMLDLVITKYSSDAMKVKMPTEPYLYWPIFETEMKNNPNLKQSPVWVETESTQRH